MNNLTWQIYRNKFLDRQNPILAYVGINALVFLVGGLASLVAAVAGQSGAVTVFINQFFAFPSLPGMWLTRFYTVATYSLFHYDLFHVLFNLLWLYWMGNLFIQFLKPKQFHVVYWGGAIFGALFFGLLFNLLPNLKHVPANLLGSSAAVMAVFAAVTTLVPNYGLRLLLFGNVKLKWVFAVYLLIDLLNAMGNYGNLGGSMAHWGGAIFGFGYIKLLQNGTDLAATFKKKPKLKVVHREKPQANNPRKFVNQDEIDAILDKISKSGYDKLTREEKQTLFDASNN